MSECEKEGSSYEIGKSMDDREKKMERKGRCFIMGIYVFFGGLRRILV